MIALAKHSDVEILLQPENAADIEFVLTYYCENGKWSDFDKLKHVSAEDRQNVLVRRFEGFSSDVSFAEKEPVVWRMNAENRQRSLERCYEELRAAQRFDEMLPVIRMLNSAQLSADYAALLDEVAQTVKSPDDLERAVVLTQIFALCTKQFKLDVNNDYSLHYVTEHVDVTASNGELLSGIGVPRFYSVVFKNAVDENGQPPLVLMNGAFKSAAGAQKAIIELNPHALALQNLANTQG